MNLSNAKGSDDFSNRLNFPSFFLFVYTVELPPAIMIEAAHKLIAFAVASGHLQRNYTLLGHRQVRQTECPGERLFEEITTWPRFSPTVPQT